MGLVANFDLQFTYLYLPPQGLIDPLPNPNLNEARLRSFQPNIHAQVPKGVSFVFPS